MKTNKLYFTLILLTIFLGSCTKYYDDFSENTKPTDKTFYTESSNLKSTTYLVSQDFEGASKTSYSAGSITLGSEHWYLNNALVGTLSGDAKNGSKSVRIRYTGSLEMQFEVTDPTNVSFYYAKFGSDGNSAFVLQYSTNGGNNWTTVGSCSVTSHTLKKASYDVNITGNVRFRILKTSGGSYRINIDDFVVISSSSSGDPGNTNPSRENNMALGNPSNAVASTSYPSNYLIVKNEYTLSYNKYKGGPNWVSWHLSAAWLGNTSRYKGNFYADPNLPSNWYAVKHSDYKYTGFDRGHMCPSADRTYSYNENKATFATTNIVPQSPYNNQRA